MINTTAPTATVLHHMAADLASVLDCHPAMGMALALWLVIVAITVVVCALGWWLESSVGGRVFRYIQHPDRERSKSAGQ